MVAETKAADVLKTEESNRSHSARADESRVLGCKSDADTQIALNGEWLASTCDRLKYPGITRWLPQVNAGIWHWGSIPASGRPELMPNTHTISRNAKVETRLLQPYGNPSVSQRKPGGVNLTI